MMRTSPTSQNQELLALAIALEEEDSRIYDEFAHGLRENYSDTAKMFNAMAEEESEHRHRLIELFRTKFGEIFRSSGGRT